VRLFVAASLPATILAALKRMQRDLRNRLDRLKWVRPESIHLTLRFIGEVPADRLGILQQSLRSVLAETGEPIELALSGVGLFPEKGKPRVLWAGLVETSKCSDGLLKLEGLRTRVERGVVEAGCQPETRPLRPHLTMARFPREGNFEGFQEAIALKRVEEPTPFTIDEIGLIQSILDPSGARYKTLEEYRI
jgi:2'-5' RNA ligase